MTRRLLLLHVSCLVLTATSAFAQWVPDGVPVSTATNDQRGPVVVPDETGGSLIGWQDKRTGNGDIYVQRLGAGGVTGWTADGVPLLVGTNHQQDLTIVPDGQGGAIVAWVDHRDTATNGADLYCRRVDPNGVPQWSADGVALCVLPENQIGVVLASDGNGGAIAAWRDFRNGTDYDVYAQRVDALGVVQWTTNGVAVATETEDQTIPHAIADGQGGAFIAWFDRRSSPDADVYAQRVSGTGVPLWTEDGISVSSQPGVQRNPFLVLDGSGGMIAAWYDSRSGSFDIYSQRVSSTGVPQWTADGVDVCTAANDQVSPIALADGSGGVIVVWYDNRSAVDSDVYAQKLHASGVPQWTADGVQVCGASGDQYDGSIATDGAGGAIVSWVDARGADADIYAQRVTAAGAPAWSADGVLLCGALLDQGVTQTISDGLGGAVVVWDDARSGERDIYAQRVLSNGYVPTPTSVTARAPSLRAGEFYPNPFAGTTWLDLELASPASVRIDVFDVAGRAMRAMTLPDLAGSRRLGFDGRDDAGRLLPSGVYFLRVSAAGQVLTRKIVIAR
jgi:hypothetical protein